MAMWERVIWVLLVSGLYLMLCAYCMWRWRRHHHRSDGDNAFADTSASVLVAYASQSGSALALATSSAKALQSAGPVRVLPLDRVDGDVLAETQHAFFVASTYGEGEPPDNGNRFAQKYFKKQSAQFSHLKFAVLALGDSAYQHFCAFGHMLHSGMADHGAIAAFDTLELDGSNAGTQSEIMQRWYRQLAHFGDDETSISEFIPAVAEYQSWRLDYRKVVNSGSPGEPLVYLSLLPPTNQNELAEQWQAGDIAEIIPFNSVKRCGEVAAQLGFDLNAELELDGERITLGAELARRDLAKIARADVANLALEGLAGWLAQLPLLIKREYSIASVPHCGSLDLLVRVQCTDGVPGVASNCLGRHLAVGDTVSLHIRSNPLFHSPTVSRPLILIGNGSGFAGLRAHLQERVHAGCKNNWLIYGERSPDADRIFSHELNEWQNKGYLPHIDLTFSRCSRQPAYVQDAILANADELKAWLAMGAAIYVCGSRNGMAESVDQQLRALMGNNAIDDLSRSGLYRRDVY
ncbi:Sulfite reductase [NADPH] flavoprotein alpha-component [Zhongshania aliphaticivorans]|uniref:NADPH--hemoprotein reductase n=1 Tax=Zhongshania aliphaticivorans TaxID=1470434 RepID=A0A5S9P732_9GAMM|nr:sulfite reductase flavoprotein subunit alpha [Zhongshania aliphaticivorans]CAA0091866.1 Sulfite reductase [NADPH] flavoprotein alpha-component [Zhongshania aliphaticivorans]CAA0099205.1 Sulfite reductase [NADPH] flavoprotein alpha-component [Zhongshania aliphaticivorans]